MSRSRVRCGHQRVDSTAQAVTVGRCQDHGEIDSLITLLRLVGRAQADWLMYLSIRSIGLNNCARFCAWSRTTWCGTARVP